VYPDRLRDLVTDPEHGVQRRQRVLEHHCDVLAPDGLELLLAQPDELPVAIEDLAAHARALR
jgi:hypothetical protein